MNKIALITGATSGIGEGCARRFARGGYNLILTGRNTGKLEILKKELEAEGVEVNEVSEADYQRCVEQVEAYCYDKMREDIGAEVWDQCTQWLEEYRAR